MAQKRIIGRLLAAGTVWVVLILTACSPVSGALILNVDAFANIQNRSPRQDNPTATATIPPVETPAPQTVSISQAQSPSGVIGIDGFDASINPLTGLVAQYPDLLNRRPIMVKVSNWPPSVRPQSGLSFADMVFEYFIGEGANRFLALYYSQDAAQVGSLRSGRLVDAQLARMYQSYLVYGSADARVDRVLNQELGDRAISNLEVNCPVICGGDTHRAPWVYANTGELASTIAEKGYESSRQNLSGMLFDTAVPESDQYAITIGVQYVACNRGEWRYDAATGKYLRWIEKWDDSQACKTYPQEPLTDYLTGQQLSFSNVIILFADYYRYNETLHDIFIWDKSISQRAVIFRDGVMVDGSWQAVSHDQPIRFYNQFGLPMALKPGNTWIVIADNHSSFSQTQPGNWDLNFSLN
jgi:hypothetical protein